MSERRGHRRRVRRAHHRGVPGAARALGHLRRPRRGARALAVEGRGADPRGGPARARRRGPRRRAGCASWSAPPPPRATAEFVFLCVQTPQSESGAADLSAVEAVVHEIAPVLRAGTVVVNKSTMPVGSTQFVARHLSEAGASSDVGVASNPEFLREGTAVRDFLEPARVVIGCDDTAVAVRVSDLYRDVQAPILVTDPASAEMIKYASNAFLATKISFINAIANLCEAVNADVREVALGMGYDTRIGFEFLHPGPGYGGSCFPKDTAALIHTADIAGYDFSLLRGVVDVNHHQHERIIEKLRDAAGGSLRDVPVGVWGLTFKANTDDLRDSPALVVCRPAARGGRAGAGLRPRRGRGGRRTRPRPRHRDRSLRRGARRAAPGPAHRVGRVPLARLRPRRRGDGAAPRAGRRPQPARPGGDAPTRASPTRASGADAASGRHRRRRVPGFAPLRPPPRARVGGRRGRQLPHRQPRQRRAPRRRRRLHPGGARRHRRDPRRRPGRRGAAPRQPREPARVPRASVRDARGRLDRHAPRARPRARERRALPARVDQRDLRRPARAPAAGELLRQRQQRRPALGVRRGQALRRGDHDGVPPRVRRRHQDRAHLQHVRAPACARPTVASCRTSSRRRCAASRSPSTATASRPVRSAS